LHLARVFNKSQHERKITGNYSPFSVISLEKIKIRIPFVPNHLKPKQNITFHETLNATSQHQPLNNNPFFCSSKQTVKFREGLFSAYKNVLNGKGFFCVSLSAKDQISYKTLERKIKPPRD
jgi:hypothetical protein